MKLVDLLFPRVCIGCGSKGNYLCIECKKQLFAHPEVCPFCHCKSSGFQTCKNCQEGQILKGIIIGFSYKGLIKKLILKSKFYHKKDVIPFLAERLSLLVKTNDILNQTYKNHNLFVSYVPSHWRRKYFEKGYNQSELLAKSLANFLDIPTLKLVSKNKYTVSQLLLNRRQRQQNLYGAFVTEDLSVLPNGATILFVDDVTTTGSTLTAVAKCIHNSRSDLNIWGIVIARNMG